MEEKVCNKCNKAKPANTRYFYQYKSKGGALRGICKECTSPGPVKRNKKEDVFNRYVVDKNNCWLYTYSKDGLGYGVFYYQHTAYKAHRVAYELINGEIPSGLVIDHLCRTRHCINPDHLEAVTQKENVRRIYLAPHCATCTCEKEIHNSDL